MGEHAFLEGIAAIALVCAGAIAVAAAFWRTRRVAPNGSAAGPARIERATAVRAMWATAIAASAGAGVIHICRAPEHLGESLPLGVGFIVAGTLQLAWGALALASGVLALAWGGLALVTRPRGVAFAGIIGNGLLIGAWATSRTVGLPIGEEPWVPEAIGRADLIAVALEAIVIAALIVVWLGWLRESASEFVVTAASIAVVPLVGLIAVATVLALSGGSDHATHHHGDTGGTDAPTHASTAVVHAAHATEGSG